MPIQITITSDTVSEARHELRELLRDNALKEAYLVGAAQRGLDDAKDAAPANAAPEQDAQVPEPTEAEATPEPAKRKRRTKAEIEADKAAEAAAPAEEPAQNISASPEDRQEPADPEDAPEAEEVQGDFFDDEAPAVKDDMIDGYAITDQGLQAVMHAYVAKFDMAAAQKNAKTLFGGFNKRSEVAAAGEDALRTAIANFARAISSGEEV